MLGANVSTGPRDFKKNGGDPGIDGAPLNYTFNWRRVPYCPGVSLKSLLSRSRKLQFGMSAALACGPALLGADLRIGIIGCDTSHVTAFTETLNNTNANGHVLGGRVVAAFKGGSDDIPSSASRVEGIQNLADEIWGQVLR
jgi:hypothetical protein